MKKIWIQTLFEKHKGILIKKYKHWADVEFVGYPFGSHPNGLIKTVPLDRISRRIK